MGDEWGHHTRTRPTNSLGSLWLGRFPWRVPMEIHVYRKWTIDSYSTGALERYTLKSSFSPIIGLPSIWSSFLLSIATTKVFVITCRYHGRWAPGMLWITMDENAHQVSTFLGWLLKVETTSSIDEKYQISFNNSARASVRCPKKWSIKTRCSHVFNTVQFVVNMLIWPVCLRHLVEKPITLTCFIAWREQFEHVSWVFWWSIFHSH